MCYRARIEQINGLKARGGFEVDIVWEKGKIKEAIIVGKPNSELLIKYDESTKSILLDQDGSIKLSYLDFE